MTENAHRTHPPRRSILVRWDEAGNLGQLSTLDEHSGEVRSRFLLWTEDNRLHTVVDDRHHSYYAYDHAGGSFGSRAQSQACLSYAEMQQRRQSQRTLKVTGRSHQLDVNAWLMHTVAGLDEFTLYPSPYLVFTNRGYTKHYYAGTERLATRIGGGFDRAILREQTDIAMTATHLFKQSQHHSNERHLNAPPAHTIRRDHLSENIYSSYDAVGERIDKESMSHSGCIGPIQFGTNGDVLIGVNVAIIFGVNIQIISRYAK